ncbi:MULTISPECIES: cupin domain-containing protein [Micromonospora]|uniref:Cupin domain-containing protein n=1 Tax=Micromonospora antibiotica TaxID=2807623 RepID=A0ABS3VFQ2_9ACTN|nr:MULTISPECIES: cupin domain-containing protein [Micromonospora]MBO4164465.1 cupin domain-containing protein [Micromonospora antibiotica]MBW4701745.1 cupin domain-containing protein [Micromonospora sp. RL09-050-HVF-A]
MLNPQLYGISVNWDDIPATEVRPGVRRKVYATDEVLFAWHELAVGMDLNPHHHDDFDQLVLILGGRCNYYVDGVPHPMGPGSLLLVPRGAEHYIEPTEGPCINVDVFAPPRADFLPHAWRPGQG